MKFCVCGNPKLPDRLVCRECRNKQKTERYKNDEKWRKKIRQNSWDNYDPAKRKARYNQFRQEAYAVLGGYKCCRCGFDDPRALQIDHINGEGYKLRKIGTEVGETLYRKVVKLKGEGFQVLCANCNWIKKSEEGHHGGIGRTRFDKYPESEEKLEEEI